MQGSGPSFANITMEKAAATICALKFRKALTRSRSAAREATAIGANLRQRAPEKPSIAVLPFANLSDDPSQDYFASGMAEDLTTDLSKLSGLIVISRHSSFLYKGSAKSAADIATELLNFSKNIAVSFEAKHAALNAGRRRGGRDPHE